MPGFPTTRAPRDHGCNQLIFDDFRNAGYATFFGTNMCDWGVMEEVFPFDSTRPPTDHHLMEPWCRDISLLSLSYLPISLLSTDHQLMEPWCHVDYDSAPRPNPNPNPNPKPSPSPSP